MIDYIQKLCPDFDSVYESILKNKYDEDIGWLSTIKLKSGEPIGGGCSHSRDTARRIAVAETLERVMFEKIFNSELKNDFLINEFPSTSGFACGFDESKTLLRAICEAAERWVWSKWIDEHCLIERSRVNSNKMPKIAQHFYDQFDEVHFFYRKFLIEHEKVGILPLQIGITIGIKDGGVFPGSRVGSLKDDLWTHALLESWRHLHIFNSKKYNKHTPICPVYLCFIKLELPVFTRFSP